MEAEWYKIRDLFWGENDFPQDIKQAMELAKACKHPDAIWLTQAFCNVDMSTLITKTQWFNHFMLLDQNDPRTLTFAWFCQRDLAELLKHAADMGYAWAQALYDIHVAKGKQYAEAACKQGERDGFFAVALYCCRARQTEEFWMFTQKAAKLGCISSMIHVGEACERMNLHQDAIKWFGKVTSCSVFDLSFKEYVFNNWSNFNLSDRYKAGKYANLFLLKKRSYTPSMQKKKWKCMIHAKNFFDEQNLLCRLAVHAWSICAKRLNIIKDMRILIATYVWKSRKLGLFPVDPQ